MRQLERLLVIRKSLLSVVSLDCGVVVFLCELHAVDELTHVFGQHLVRHLHLAVRAGREGRDEAVHRGEQFPQLQPNLFSEDCIACVSDRPWLTFLTRSR